jgi:catechol 2,3-dioxygenase-like lactoylglutathione lyase family enzyme
LWLIAGLIAIECSPRHEGALGTQQFAQGSDVLTEEFKKIERVEPIIRADAMQYITFARRDVPEMARFLADFGFVPLEHEGETLYFRGYGDAPFLVSVTPSDEDRLISFGIAARTAEDLETLSRATGVPMEMVDAPGGGRRVSLTDPEGIQVDLIYGFERAAPLETRHQQFPFNTPGRKARLNATIRPALEPSPIFKLGHVVLQSPNFDRTAQWYTRHFGIIPSDVQCLPDGQPGLGFFRLDRGSEPADHHSIAILGGPGAKLLHVSFETFDIDSVAQGQQFLRAQGWEHFWGIGRHVLGSQVFDYWKDPAGDEWEHYADGDVMNADYPTNYIPLTRGSLWSWGDDLPESMRPPFEPEQVEELHAAGVFGDVELSHVKGLMEALKPAPRPWLR